MDRAEMGRRGEEAAAQYLERVGMTVEARNWRCAFGEVDIVAWDGDDLVLCEVKTRRSESAGSAEEAVSAAKRKRLARLAEAYAASGARAAARTRFDVVAIRVIANDRALLRHYRNAFEVGA